MQFALVSTFWIMMNISYPPARQTDTVDDYFGTQVKDPYRWLEDENSDETKAWIAAENQVTESFLADISERPAIAARLKKLADYARYSPPARYGKLYFFSKNDGLQNQAVYYTSATLDGEPRLLLNPNQLSADATISVNGFQPSEDGRKVAYSTSDGGSDWQTWRVRDVTTGKDLSDEIKWSKFSGAAWKKDSSGFFYQAFSPPKENEALTEINKSPRLMFHQVGTPATADTVVYSRPDQPEWSFNAEVTDDGRYLLIYQNQGTDTRNRVFIRDLTQQAGQVEPFLDQFEGRQSILGNDRDTFYVLTDIGAPRFRVVAIKKSQPTSKDWTTLIPENPGRDVMASVTLVGERFVVSWRSDAHENMKVYRRDGEFERDVPLPTLGSVDSLYARRKDAEGFFAFTSFTYPTTIYRYELKTGATSVWKKPSIDVNPNDYENNEVFYSSKDGTKIPLFVVHKKGIKLDGTNPTYLYGYGGFNISLGPGFSIGNLLWLEMGGVYAQPSLRGGGEYGNSWHDAGRLDKKQNVFDDFIAAAEWLIQHGYTSTAKLAIGGGSNGGLLVGACLTQRPDLFGAAIAQVGVMDMLRYHKYTIGWAWASDYGTSDTKAGFDTLIQYSPLQRLTPGTSYPATLITTGDHDDRVVPAHSFKFAATLQADQSGPAPVLIRVETRGGHGGGKPLLKELDERADIWAFLVKALHMTPAVGSGPASTVR